MTVPKEATTPDMLRLAVAAVLDQPQQIKPNNAPHAHPHFRRGHYRDRVTSQLMVAA